MLPAVLDVGVGRKMEDEVAAPHRGGERGQVEVVAPKQRETRLLERPFEKRRLPGGEIVPADHAQPVGQQAVD